jgi:hypothetical protein
MMWWFLILGFGIAAIIWASLSLYLRVNRHMHSPEEASAATPGDVEIGRKASIQE